MPKKLSAVVSTIWNHTDSVTKWLQILALILAGGWAYFHFRKVEGPTLETRLAIGQDLRSEILKSDSCLVTFGTRIQNVGVASVYVAKVQVRIWSTPLPTPSSEKLTYFDLNKIEQTNPIEAPRVLEGSNLLGHYPPGTERDETNHWTMPPQTRQARQVYIFRMDAFDGQGKFLGSGQQWSPDVCVPADGR